jgi:putative ATP-dependent endonuclease of the OLD family
MRIAHLTIENYRGISKADIKLPKHAVLIGDNNTGKTTILEALDLVLGPDRLKQQPPIDEHDFFRGKYMAAAGTAPDDAADAAGDAPVVTGPPPPVPDLAQRDEALKISITVTVADLSDEQKAKFGDYVEFWDSSVDAFYEEPAPAGVDAAHITEAIRVTFHGRYDEEEDDFEGQTYFTRSLTEDDKPAIFTRRHKQVCGFLYLRSRRTGSRALSLERGSLLDIILRLKEVRPKMWEDTLRTLSFVPVASDPDLGIAPVLESIDAALKKYVPKEWGVEPHLKVSNLTREHLRKVITAFIATGEGPHAAPYYRQGAGTINMLVLAMLSQIAEDKQNVIFAMEEPETAIPPYAQKRIVHEVTKLASQTLFTSHSPYVLEEFAFEDTVVLGRDAEGVLNRKPITLPDNVKLKRYRQEFRTRFCEGLLARRVLIAEGATEASAFPVACRRLAELKPDTYSSLEALGICVVDAGGDGDVSGIAQLYRTLGKRTFALCDKQDEGTRTLIEAQVELLLMHEEGGFEDLVLKGTSGAALSRFAKLIEWPPHLKAKYAHPEAQAADALADYFQWSKGSWGIADFFAQCTEDEMPAWIREACLQLKEVCAVARATAPPAPAAATTAIGGGADAADS